MAAFSFSSRILVLSMVLILANAKYQLAPVCLPGNTSAVCPEPAPVINDTNRPGPVYGEGRIIDITHPITSKLPAYGSSCGLGTFIWLDYMMAKNKSGTNNSRFMLPVHTGTHVDSPSHVFDEYYDRGYDVDTLDLDALNGHVRVMDVPRDSNITAKVLQGLNFAGVERVLFRTLNTDRKLMYDTVFHSDYVGITTDGAEWLVANTQVRLVGIDYLSMAPMTDLLAPHRILLKHRNITVVEGLNLDPPHVAANDYNLHCLPLRLRSSEGSPVRCILVDFSALARANNRGATVVT